MSQELRMRKQKRFYFLASITMLVVMLLPQRGSSLAPSAPTLGRIPFTEHTIDGDFLNAKSVYATDVDGDGDVDILGAASVFDDEAICWWENDGSQNFAKHIITSNFDMAYAVYAIDVDGDGDVDVLGAALAADDIAWWENDGSENFTEHTIDGSFDGANAVFAIDVDGDGDMDVLGAAREADDIAWWENDGSENFDEHTIDGYFEYAKAVYAIDVDGDGDVDILGAASIADDITWWENDGSEHFAEHTIEGDFDHAQSVYATDVDGDGDVDVIGAADDADGDIIWWENDGNENFTQHVIARDFSGADVYATDVDGDGDTDVLGGSWIRCDINWWENDGSENFTQHAIDTSYCHVSSVYATDVDGDGDVDILGTADDDDDITWWEQGPPLKTVLLPAISKNAAPPASAPVLDDISNPDGDGNYVVSWSAVERATAYVLHEDDNADFSSPVVAYSGSNTSKSITGRDVGTYYYRVKAMNEMGSSDWSEIKSVEVTVEPTPPPCPDPGAWSGSTNQGYPIDFAVADNCWVTELTIEYVVTCPTGIMWKTKTFDYYTSISDDSFEYDDDGDPTVSGHFSSQTSASGTWSSSFYLPGVGDCSGSGTWSASGP
jgi:hypothetical protein